MCTKDYETEIGGQGPVRTIELRGGEESSFTGCIVTRILARATIGRPLLGNGSKNSPP
jgi:hypothetical protein